MSTRPAIAVLGVAAVGAIGGGLALALYRQWVQSQEEEARGVDAGSVPMQPILVPKPGAAHCVLSTVLKGNEAVLSTQEAALVSMLLEQGQEHLFKDWPAPGVQDADKKRLLAQLLLLDRAYHGGLAAYLNNAKQLLRDSREGRNPFEGYTPSVPDGVRVDYAGEEFLAHESQGLQEAGAAAFVLVAGGLGERLGYSGIKVALPTESATGTCFLSLYIQYILALQGKCAAPGVRLPLAIMTSDDTHARTQALLQEHSYFGMDPSQITLMKQEKVACLIDNDAHLAVDPQDPYKLQTKPHGHGDVHALLHSTGLARKWADAGLRWVCFFQDTNALVFRALLVALGVSGACDYDMNSLAVPRRAKEAIGAICRLEHTDGSAMTVNVEYNQLDPLLRSTILPQGDANDDTGYSPFPGNINQLVIKLQSYVHTLARTGGVISEFVNPKYKDATKKAFKSSTRLECMMQDYPKSLSADAKVGFTVINQVWATYSPVKNNPADARVKAAEGDPTHSATAAEMDVYKANALTLQLAAGAHLPPVSEAMYNGIPVEEYPRVVLSPGFAPSVSDIKAKVSPGSVLLAPRSVLVLEGQDITVSNLRVDGALVVRAVPGAHVAVEGLSVSNAGWAWTPLEQATEQREEEAIRGFRVIRHDTATFEFDQPGYYTLPTATAPAPAPGAGAGAAAADLQEQGVATA